MVYSGAHLHSPARYRDDVANIIRSADVVMGEIERRLTGRPEKGPPLFFFIGEQHSMSAHILTQIRVMELMRLKGIRFSFGQELPHNFYAQMVKDRINRAPCTEDRKQAMHKAMAEIDSADPVHLHALSSRNTYKEARLSSQVQSRYLLAHGISSAFNDAAIRYDGEEVCLDAGEAKTREAIIDAGGEKLLAKNTPIPLHSPAAILIRNQFMSVQIMDHAAQTEPQVYVMRCGRDHVAGASNTAFRHSLLNAFSIPGLGAFGAALYEDKPAEDVCRDNLIEKECAFLSGEFSSAHMRQEQIWLNHVAPEVLPGHDYHVDLDGFAEACRIKEREYFKARIVPEALRIAA